MALEDVVVVAEFKDTIYPGLISTGKVKRGGDKPYHTVINAENYHALRALTWSHRGKVDAIYIDPPYNSGARDWKYNNFDAEASKLATEWLAKYRDQIKRLPDDRQESYRQISALSREPQDVDLARPFSYWEKTEARAKDGSETRLPRYEHHVLCDEDGAYPAELNKWETAVLKAETERDGFKLWYRNPNRPTQDSLGIAYVDGGETKILRPDFLFFVEDSNNHVVVDIVDPHSVDWADALAKLKGLAQYAATHAKVFRRIAAIAEVGGGFAYST